MAVLKKNTKMMLKAKELRVCVIETNKQWTRLQITVKNKVGEFVLYPNIGINDIQLAVGQSVVIVTDDKFKVKTAFEIL